VTVALEPIRDLDEDWAEAIAQLGDDIEEGSERFRGALARRQILRDAARRLERELESLRERAS
jgi:hypothetical protein